MRVNVFCISELSNGGELIGLTDGVIKPTLDNHQYSREPMSFEPEQLTEEQSKEVANWISKSQMVLCKPLYRFVDRTHGSVFFDLGGRGSFPREPETPPTYYALIWQDQVIVFEGYEQPHVEDDQADVDVDISAMRMPCLLEGNEGEIKQAIEDALTAYWLHRKGQLLRLRIAFPKIETY